MQDLQRWKIFGKLSFNSALIYFVSFSRILCKSKHLFEIVVYLVIIRNNYFWQFEIVFKIISCSGKKILSLYIVL